MKRESKRKNPKETILVLGAHSDDFVIGAGGTLKKYIDEGKHIISIIFSYGENSHPWLERKVTVEMRVKETNNAVKYLGVQENIFLGLKENKFPEEINEKKILDKLSKIVRERKPSKIFTHSVDDPLPDHRAVYRATLELIKETEYKGDVYTYNIWNPLRIKHREHPKLFVDVTKTFKDKIAAFKMYKSQWVTILHQLPFIYFRNLRAGNQHGCKYAEIFIKIR